MKKKLLFLSVALALCAMPASVLTSCSGGDEPEQPSQSVSVANTTWEGDDGSIYKFYSDGTCELGGALQEYRQVGNEINLVGKLAWYNKRLYYTRYAYVKGDVMEIEMRRELTDPFSVVKFYKVK